MHHLYSLLYFLITTLNLILSTSLASLFHPQGDLRSTAGSGETNSSTRKVREELATGASDPHEPSPRKSH